MKTTEQILQQLSNHPNGRSAIRSIQRLMQVTAALDRESKGNVAQLVERIMFGQSQGTTRDQVDDFASPECCGEQMRPTSHDSFDCEVCQSRVSVIGWTD